MKKDIILFLMVGTIIFVGFLILGGYAFIEPSETEAVATTTVVTLTVTEEISITPPAAITMSPNITMSANSSIGTGSAWNVKTNSQAGYALTLKEADAAPALLATTTSETFSDASSTPSTWGFSTSGQACYDLTLCFGFSVYGDDVNTGTWGTGSSCGDTGTPSATLKYRGYNGTSEITVATSTSETTTSGTDTVMCVAAAQNTVYAPDGVYQTTITGTATAN